MGPIGIVIFLAMFLAMFIGYYRTSKKFRFSIRAAFVAALVSLVPLKSQASKVEGFTVEPNPHSTSRVQQNRGHFSNPNKNNLGPGAQGNSGSPGNGGSNDGDGSVIFPQLESKEKTEKRIDQIDHYIREMETVDDSDSENESFDHNDVIKNQEQATQKKTEKAKTKKPKLIKDPNLNDDGSLKLGKIKEIESKTGQKVEINQDLNTKKRRSLPMLKSSYQDEKSQFYPAYSIEQLEFKEDHTADLLDQSTAEDGITSLDYNELLRSEKIATSLAVCEALLNAPDTEIYHNVSHLSDNDEEPCSLAINFGFGDYPIPNHGALFENKPSYTFDSFVTQFQLTDSQVEKFNASRSTNPVVGTQKTTQTSSTVRPEPEL